MRSLWREWTLAILALSCAAAAPGLAGVTITGDAQDNGSIFTLGGTLNSTGSLVIDAGSVFNRTTGSIGRTGGSMCMATVIGTGSAWTNSGELYVGYDGHGTLTVSDGGLVSTGTLYASLSDLYGNGTIIVQSGAILDADLIFDTTHGTTQTLGFGSDGALQLTINGAGILGVGYKQSGTLRIAAGRSVNSTYGYLGRTPGSSGSATVTGAGSKWINTNQLLIGSTGSGTLWVEAGGQVSNSSGSLGYNSRSAGTVVVTGPGSAWTNSGDLSIGQDGSAMLRVEAGGQVSSVSARLSSASDSTNMAVVTGAGSTWTNSLDLCIGFRGNGMLKVEAGGQVSNVSGYLSHEPGSTGTAIITGAGSKWINSEYLIVGGAGRGTLTVSDGGLVSAKTVYASLSDLHGDGTITANGAVLDADVVFDAAHATTQGLPFGSGGALRLTFDGTGSLGVGYKGFGTLRIADGRSVNSTYGFLGDGPNSRGTTTVTGPGSKWTSSGELYVARFGAGTLRVEAGAQLRNTFGCLGYYSGSTGRAIITGAGSTWTNSRDLYVGVSGSGMLTVSDGGQVTSTALSINSQSMLRLHVSGDRMLVLGKQQLAGSISNSGKLSLLADAFLPAGDYRPIGEYADRTLTWSGNGSTLAVGGTWNKSTGIFTVMEPTGVDAGEPAAVAAGRRLLITDAVSGDRAGVSFGALTSGTTLTAAPANQTELAALMPLLDSHEQILAGWTFAGSLAGGESLVSYEVGAGAANLRLWRLSQNVWSAYTPQMLTQDGHGIVSFTADVAALNCSAYAVTVPEPAALGLLAMAGLALLKRKR